MVTAFWSTRQEQPRRSLNYEEWQQWTGPREVFLQKIEYPHLPWAEFRDPTWIQNDLYPILQDVVQWVRRTWNCSRFGTSLENASCRKDQNVSETAATATEARQIVELLCAILEGLAASWGRWEDDDGVSTRNDDIGLSTPSTRISETDSSKRPVLTQQVDDLVHQSSQEPGSSTSQEDTSVESSRERYAIECLNLVIEALASGVICSHSLAALILDRSNEGLLLFEALATSDRRVQFDILLVLEQLLYHGQEHNFLAKERDRTPTSPVSKQPMTPTSSEADTASGACLNIPERIAQALIRSPHAIGNLMAVMEQAHDDDVSYPPPRFVKNQCLAVLKRLVRIHHNSELKTIMTFQSLPEILIDTLRTELIEPDAVPRDSDISVVGIDCLACLQSLVETLSARKYFHQTGLLQQLLDILKTLEPQFHQYQDKYPRGLFALLQLFLTFVQGSQDDLPSFPLRRDLFLNTKSLALLLRCVVFTLTARHPGTQNRLRLPYTLLLVLFCTDPSVSAPLILNFLDPPELQQATGDGVLHEMATLLFTSYPSFHLAQRFLLLEILETILRISPSVQLHALSTCWTLDPLCPTHLQPFGILIEYAYTTLIYDSEASVAEWSSLPPWLHDRSMNHNLSSAQPFNQATAEDQRTLLSDVHMAVWIGTRLFMALLQSNPVACQKALDMSTRSKSNESLRSSRSLSDLIVDTLVTLVERCSTSTLSDLAVRLPASVTADPAEDSDSPVAFSSFTSIVILLQLCLLWSKNTPELINHWVNNASFLPSVFQCVELGESSASSEPRPIETVPQSTWHAFIQGLAVALLVAMLRISPDQDKKSPLHHLITALERRFTLKRLARKYYGLFTLPGAMASVEKNDVFDVKDVFSIVESCGNADSESNSRSSTKVFFFDRSLARDLYTFRDQVEPFFIRIYLDTYSVPEAGPPSNCSLPLDNQTLLSIPKTEVASSHPSSETTTVTELRALLVSHDADLQVLRKEKQALVQQLNGSEPGLAKRYLQTPDDIIQENSLLLRDIQLLQAQMRDLIREQHEQHEAYEAHRRCYMSRLTVLKDQLRGVIQGYQQLEVKFQTLAAHVPEELLHSIMDESSSASKNMRAHLRPDQKHEDLLELLGFLAETFPDVKEFLERFDLEHGGNIVLLEPPNAARSTVPRTSSSASI